MIMVLKNKTLISKLLMALAVENGDSFSKEDLERYMDDLVNAHEVYPTFKDRQIQWNVEEHAKMKNASFLKTLNSMSDGNDLINICFSPKCNGCERDLKKLKVEDMSYTFRCNTCGVDYTFEVIHTGNAISEEIDKDDFTSL
jgi:hypothetical protein